MLLESIIEYLFERKEQSVKSILMSTPTPLKLNVYLMPSGGPGSTLFLRTIKCKEVKIAVKVAELLPLLQYIPAEYFINF